MKVCTQCASLTNRPVRINKEIICQGCANKMNPIEKLEFIQNVKDKKGYDHSVFIVKVKTINNEWKRVFKYGNLTYPTMKDVKEVINAY